MWSIFYNDKAVDLFPFLALNFGSFLYWETISSFGRDLKKKVKKIIATRIRKSIALEPAGYHFYMDPKINKWAKASTHIRNWPMTNDQ